MPQPSQPAVGTSPNPIGDDGLVLRRIAEGDVAALGTLFDQVSKPVYSLVMQLLRNHDDAEDIVELTFWQAWQDSAKLLDESDPRGWLLSTGRRRALDRLRSRRRSREELVLDKRQFGDLVASFAGQSGVDESRENTLRLLRDLGGEERQILELSYFRGLSQADIADLTGDSGDIIKSRMTSALERLRDKSSTAEPE